MSLPSFSTLGSGDTTVLMLHGAEGSHLSFAPQLETLATAGYRAVAWDMPGYGNSAPIEPYNFKGLAQQAIALIEALRSPRLVLLGHGMGAALALELSIRRPELVQRLALINSLSMHTPNMILGVADKLSRISGNHGESMSMLAEREVPSLIGTGHLPEGVRLIIHAYSQVPAATYRRALEALVAFDRSQALAQIGCPTLVLTGEQDPCATPAASRELAARIGLGMSSDVVTLKGIGHYANLEAPDEFDGALLRWLSLTQADKPSIH